MLRLAVSRRAAMDMRAIFKTSLRTWGVFQAEMYLRSLSGAVENLREFPDMGKVLPIIIYRVTGERLHVVRVLHESMDIGQHI